MLFVEGQSRFLSLLKILSSFAAEGFLLQHKPPENGKKGKVGNRNKKNFSSHPPPYKLVYPWRPNQCCKVPDLDCRSVALLSPKSRVFLVRKLRHHMPWSNNRQEDRGSTENIIGLSLKGREAIGESCKKV